MSRRGQPLERKKRAERLGRLAELAASLWLQLKGYQLLARRVRNGAGELDLVLRRGRTLAVVEVKARPTVAEGLEAVSDQAARRICSAAEVWAESRPALSELHLRFDLVIITPWSPPRHLRDAWRPDDPV